MAADTVSSLTGVAAVSSIWRQHTCGPASWRRQCRTLPSNQADVLHRPAVDAGRHCMWQCGVLLGLLAWVPGSPAPPCRTCPAAPAAPAPRMQGVHRAGQDVAHGQVPPQARRERVPAPALPLFTGSPPAGPILYALPGKGPHSGTNLGAFATCP